jgi:hypothetical protein
VRLRVTWTLISSGIRTVRARRPSRYGLFMASIRSRLDTTVALILVQCFEGRRTVRGSPTGALVPVRRPFEGPASPRTYEPSTVRARNLLLTRTSRSAAQVERSRDQNRAACASVRRSPGISRYSARTRSSRQSLAICSTGMLETSLSATYFAISAGPNAGHEATASRGTPGSSTTGLCVAVLGSVVVV